MMIHSRMIGEARVTNLVEYIGPTHDPMALHPDLTAETLERHKKALVPDHWYETVGRLVVGIQIWIVRTGNEVILVDSGVGNGKSRGAGRMHMLNSLVPEWLAAAGVRFDDVTHVIMTHLHGDHVGWNTIDRDGIWVPAFTNARYLMPEADLAYFEQLAQDEPTRAPFYADSIEPVVKAGLVDFYHPGDTLPGGLVATDASGHTPGMVNLWIGEGDRRGVFCADIFHTPLQILVPSLNTAFCVIQDAARETRAQFLDKVADTGTLVMPCHFGEPHCGYVLREGDGYAFKPEPANERWAGG